MSKMPMKEAAERCGLKLEQLRKILAYPETDPRRPKTLVVIDDDHLDADSVFAYVKRSEDRQNEKYILDDESLTLVLHEAGKMRHGKRNQALIALSNYAAPRAVEISRMMISDIVDGRGQLVERAILKRARTKNKDKRVLFFKNKILRRYMEAYLAERFAEGAKPEDPLFVGVVSKKQMTRHNMARAITYIYEQCGHPECTSHSGRARLATKVIKTCDVKAAQLLLGHANPETTMIYGRYTEDELAKLTEDL